MTFDYQNSSNLRVRRNLYDRFSTRMTSGNSWIVSEVLAEERPLTLLDIGGGYGSVWSEFRSCFQVDVVVTDISGGMLKDAPGHLPRAAMSAERLAVRSGCFDVVTAFSVLYHVKQPDAAFQQIVRVLKPWGILVFTTLGTNHLLELREIIQRHAGDLREQLVAIDFPLDSAAEKAHRYFADVAMHVFPESLVVDSANAIMEYIRTTPLGSSLTSKQFDAIEHDLRFRCSVGKGLSIRTEAAKFVCRRALCVGDGGR